MNIKMPNETIICLIVALSSFCKSMHLADTHWVVVYQIFSEIKVDNHKILIIQKFKQYKIPTRAENLALFNILIKQDFISPNVKYVNMKLKMLNMKLKDLY